MANMELLIDAWDEGHREFSIALEGLPDEDLWKRPTPSLLSVGELAGHIAYWQAVWSLGGGNERPDIAALPVQSPLLDDSFRYYSSNIEAPIELSIGTAEVLEEVMRIHDVAKSEAVGKDSGDAYPGQWGTWSRLVQYQVFHVAYHTGQIYSVRHLLGHETEDN